MVPRMMPTRVTVSRWSEGESRETSTVTWKKHGYCAGQGRVCLEVRPFIPIAWQVTRSLKSPKTITSGPFLKDGDRGKEKESDAFGSPAIWNTPQRERERHKWVGSQ